MRWCDGFGSRGGTLGRADTLHAPAPPLTCASHRVNVGINRMILNNDDSYLTVGKYKKTSSSMIDGIVFMIMVIIRIQGNILPLNIHLSVDTTDTIMGSKFIA